MFSPASTASSHKLLNGPKLVCQGPFFPRRLISRSVCLLPDARNPWDESEVSAYFAVVVALDNSFVLDLDRGTGEGPIRAEGGEKPSALRK